MAPHPDSPRSSTSIPPWAVLCFLVSGAAGLVYEIVWSKEIAYLLGSALQSVATVTAAFLGGLALGAQVLGTRLARQPAPGRRYAQLELGVGILGLAILPLLRGLDPVIGAFYRSFGGESAAFAILRLLLLLVVLVPPAALMGATLPVLVARCERGALGAGLAALYAINTFGAVAGSWLAGFYLMPRLGLTRATFVAAALNLVAAGIAFAFARDTEPVAETNAAADAPAPALASDRARAAFAALFACSGFAALALQLAWVRLYSLILGSSVYSFAGVLGTYLAGIAIGSALIAPFVARRASLALFAFLELGIAIGAVAGIHAYGNLPGGMLALGERTGPSWSHLVVGQLGLVVPVLAVPCLLLGAAFPLGARLLQRGSGAGATGAAYALNTLGTIAGSLAGGFLLLPALGVQGLVILTAAISAAVGVACVALSGPPRKHAGAWALTLLLVAAGALVARTAPPWDPVLMSLGTYRPHHARNVLASFQGAGAVGDPARTVAAAQRTLYQKEGLNASVIVTTDLEGKRRWLRVGGKIDAGTGDMLTQVALGLLPAAMCPPGVRTLVVGLGSGATAAAALAGGAGKTDVVELEPAVVQASRFFHEPREDPLDDPRVTLYVEDARTVLEHGAGRYGLVVSEPSNPWIAGVNNVFTVDFYRRVHARLEPDGVFCQWLQLYELSPATFHSLLASFLDVFPNAQLYCLWHAYDLLLVAAPPGREPSLARLQTAAAQRQIEIGRMGNPFELPAFYVGPAALLAPHLAGAERNTDDRPVVEYRAPQDLIEIGRGATSYSPAVLAELPHPVVPPAAAPFTGWPRRSLIEWRAREKMFGADDAAAAGAVAEVRAAGLPSLADSLAADRQKSLADARLAQLEADARQAFAANDMATARGKLEELARSGVTRPQVLLLLAEARRRSGDAPGSAAAAEQALAAPGLDSGLRLEALLTAGMAAYETHDLPRARQRFQAAQAEAPADPRAYDYEARLCAAVKDLAGAKAALLRGLGHAPHDPTLTMAMQALGNLEAQR